MAELRLLWCVSASCRWRQRQTYGDVGVLFAGLFDGDVAAGDGCCVTVFLVGAYSLKDLCFLLVVLFPARYEKLSRYDLFLLLVNMLLDIAFSSGRGDRQPVVKAVAQRAHKKV